jgi:hypothetical protein
VQTHAPRRCPRQRKHPRALRESAKSGYTETSSNRIFVTVEALYGFKPAIAAGLKRLVKP